jgi:hypothetical protein
MEEGRGFCPHCGKAVVPGAGAADASGTASGAVAAAPPRAFSMSSFEPRAEDADKSRRAVFIAVALLSALLVAGLAYWASRPSARPGEERLEGAIRPGSPEFEQVRSRLVVEFDPDENAVIGANALGNYVVTMKPTVRNFTGRTVNGLEFHAAGLDPSDKVIRERTSVMQEELEPNKISTPAVGLNFPSDNKPAKLKLELTGVRFK